MPQALLPLDSFESRDLAELVQGALSNKSKQRSFKSWKEFARFWKPHMKKLWAKDKALFLQYYEYECFLTELSIDRSWAAANFYHWEFFRAVKDGSGAMSTPCNLRVLMEVDANFPATEAEGRLQQCDLHGWCNHATEECEDEPAEECEAEGDGPAEEEPPDDP